MYHFVNNSKDHYYHNIPIEKERLERETDEEIINWLYLKEAYYFNPNYLKRHQVQRMVSKLKTHAGQFSDVDKSPERHSIHSNGYVGSNSPQPVRS